MLLAPELRPERVSLAVFPCSVSLGTDGSHVRAFVARGAGGRRCGRLRHHGGRMIFFWYLRRAQAAAATAADQAEPEGEPLGASPLGDGDEAQGEETEKSEEETDE